MTVRELIEALGGYDPELEVWLEVDGSERGLESVEPSDDITAGGTPCVWLVG